MANLQQNGIDSLLIGFQNSTGLYLRGSKRCIFHRNTPIFNPIALSCDSRPGPSGVESRSNRSALTLSAIRSAKAARSFVSSGNCDVLRSMSLIYFHLLHRFWCSQLITTYAVSRTDCSLCCHQFLLLLLD